MRGGRGSVGLAEGYLALVETYLAQSQRHFMLIYWRRTTAMMQVYWSRAVGPGRKIMMMGEVQSYRVPDYILRYRTR